MHYGDGRYAPGPGRWHYVAGVYNEPAQTITVYVDGLAQDVEHAGPLPAASGPLEVGAGQLNPAAPDTFIGAVDELRIYPRALSPADVWQLYQASRSA
jgi:hypothetical protein